jgi:hypothetical protein
MGLDMTLTAEYFLGYSKQKEDDCRPYDVLRGEIHLLIDICKRVISNNELSEILLPRKSGFFFGSTNYDTYYFDSLVDTVKMLEKGLTLPDNWVFKYQSSW